MKLPSFPAERIRCGRRVEFYLSNAYTKSEMNYKSVCICVCTIYICLIYTTCDSVISELPRYHSTPSTFLMSVSSAGLSPRSKSTVRRAASCGHDDNVTSRAGPCSMMAEEPLPPKSASTASFRCKDGRSARPHTVAANFDPKNWTRLGEIWNTDGPKMV